MTSLAITDPFLLEYPSLSYRMAPGGGVATLDLGAGGGDPPDTIILHGRQWTLRHTDRALAMRDDAEAASIEGVLAVYDEYPPAERFLSTADAGELALLVAPLVSGTVVSVNPEGDTVLGEGSTFVQRLNWWLRYSYSAGWLSDGTGTVSGVADLMAGKPLAALLDNLLGDARTWGDLTQRLQTAQLAPVVEASSVRLIDLTDPRQPRAARDAGDLDLLSPWRERIHATDFLTERIRCYYWPGGESDFEQAPTGGEADRVVDDMANDSWHARAEIDLQRERLRQAHFRASVSLPSDLSLGIDLYDVLAYRGRYWRVMEMTAQFGQTDGTTDLTMMFIGSASEN